MKMTFKKAELENLAQLAERLDAEGKTEEAMAVDMALNKLITAAKEEAEEAEQKGPRAMSNKAKAKFRAVKKACESLVAADLDYRGPNKSSCRKVEMLCEEILDALKDCDLSE
jgi:predicted DNA-binding transcriptional regulator YafY